MERYESIYEGVVYINRASELITSESEAKIKELVNQVNDQITDELKDIQVARQLVEKELEKNSRKTCQL
ncbi:MAG TPA: hypothetical protein DCZ10_09390, partial [Pelotomaculum sp.]|nr:hypothetical protein [Pelotomaculum sp.]